MSGPKVFHVVTREELVARCEVHLRQLDAAIAEWTKACKHKGAADAHETEAVASRRDALRRMLKDGRFSELQKQVPAELSFLRADAQARIERAAAAAAQVMQNRRRTAHTARTLLEALGKSGRRMPEDLRRALESHCKHRSRHSACIRASSARCRQRCDNRPATRTGFQARARRKTCNVGRMAGEPARAR
jgi:hypothetical protein